MQVSQAATELNPLPSPTRCQILAKKGFLKLKNVQSELVLLLHSSEFQLGVLFHLPPFGEEQEFTHSALALILSEFESMGVRKRDLTTYLVGGSTGDKHAAAAVSLICRLLRSHGVSLSAQDIGGDQVRSVWMDVESGRTIIRSEPVTETAAEAEEPLQQAC